MLEGTYIEKVVASRSVFIRQVSPMMVVCVKDNSKQRYRAMTLLDFGDFYVLEKHIKSEKTLRQIINLNVIVNIEEQEEKEETDAINEDSFKDGYYWISPEYAWRWFKINDFEPWVGALGIGNDPPLWLDDLRSILNEQIKFVAEYLPKSDTWNVYYDRNDAEAAHHANYLQRGTKANVTAL